MSAFDRANTLLLLQIQRESSSLAVDARRLMRIKSHLKSSSSEATNCVLLVNGDIYWYGFWIYDGRGNPLTLLPLRLQSKFVTATINDQLAGEILFTRALSWLEIVALTSKFICQYNHFLDNYISVINANSCNGQISALNGWFLETHGYKIAFNVICKVTLHILWYSY